MRSRPARVFAAVASLGGLAFIGCNLVEIRARGNLPGVGAFDYNLTNPQSERRPAATPPPARTEAPRYYGDFSAPAPTQPPEIPAPRRRHLFRPPRVVLAPAPPTPQPRKAGNLAGRLLEEGDSAPEFSPAPTVAPRLIPTPSARRVVATPAPVAAAPTVQPKGQREREKPPPTLRMAASSPRPSASSYATGTKAFSKPGYSSAVVSFMLKFLFGFIWLLELPAFAIASFGLGLLPGLFLLAGFLLVMSLFMAGYIGSGILLNLFLFVILFNLWRHRLSGSAYPPRLTTLASGGFATFEENERAGLFEASDLALARAYPRPKMPQNWIQKLIEWCEAAFFPERREERLAREKDPELLCLPGEGHICCIAPSGAGKGVGLVIPCCLQFSGSLVATDIKGEVCAVTARYRRETLGQKVHVIDPFGITDFEPDGIDLLAAIKPDSFVDDCKHLAAIFAPMPPATKPEEEFWINSARELLAGLIGHIVKSPSLPDGKRNIGMLRWWLSLPPDVFAKRIEDMANGEMVHQDGAGEGADASGGEAAAAPERAMCDPFVAGCANGFLSMPEKLRGSVLTQVRSCTSFLDSPGVVEALSKGTCDLSQLKREPMTVYFAIPDRRLKSHAGFLRLLTAATLSAIKNDARGPGRVLFMLDEFGNLGKVEEIEDDLTLLRGYKGHICIIAQSIGQLRKLYGDAGFDNIMANSKAQIFFGIGDLGTQKYVSELLGEQTIELISNSVAQTTTQAGGQLIGIHARYSAALVANPAAHFIIEGRTGQSTTAHSFTTNKNLTTRAVMTAEEIGRMDNTDIILKIQTARCILARRLNYLRDAEFAGKFDDNPMHGVLSMAAFITENK